MGRCHRGPGQQGPNGSRWGPVKLGLRMGFQRHPPRRGVSSWQERLNNTPAMRSPNAPHPGPSDSSCLGAIRRDLLRLRPRAYAYRQQKQWSLASCILQVFENRACGRACGAADIWRTRRDGYPAGLRPPGPHQRPCPLPRRPRPPRPLPSPLPRSGPRPRAEPRPRSPLELRPALLLPPRAPPPSSSRRARSAARARAGATGLSLVAGEPPGDDVGRIGGVVGLTVGDDVGLGCRGGSVGSVGSTSMASGPVGSTGAAGAWPCSTRTSALPAANTPRLGLPPMTAPKTWCGVCPATGVLCTTAGAAAGGRADWDL